MANRVIDSGASRTSPRGKPLGSLPNISPAEVKEFIQPLEKLILQYPAIALASAFIVGVTLAWWIKRK
jgi:hypothetical protein